MKNFELFTTEAKGYSIKETAEVLGVSIATVNNWLKLKVLEIADSQHKKQILKSSVHKLKDEIISGKSEKLQARANKKHTSKKRKHNELNENITEQFLISIDSYLDDYSSDEILLSIAKIIIQKEKKQVPEKVPTWITNIENEIKSWATESKARNFLDCKLTIDDECLKASDLLGKTYQHISASSQKAKGGVFYTPSNITKTIIKSLQHKNDRVLDPSCGSGAFLIESLKMKLENKENDPLSFIYGLDIDKTAIRICRFNLLLIAKELFNGSLNIYEADSIKELSDSTSSKIPSQVEFIATNPPWGANFTLPEGSFKSINYISDSFAVFLSLSIDKLAHQGRLSFVLPESFVDVGVHSNIRKKLLSETSNIKIEKLGKVFNGLITNVVTVEGTKAPFEKNSVVELLSKEKTTLINQDKLLNDKHSTFIFNVSEHEESVLSKILKTEHKFIGKESDFALGIVTGNNAKLISSEILPGYEVILKGKDINKYKITESQQYILFDKKSFQQCAHESYFRAEEKIVYRFIANRFIMAYDDKQRLTLNSANILIPKIGIPIKVVLAILQSNIGQFLFKVKFNSIKILRNHIESIPIFIFDMNINQVIEDLVSKLIEASSTEALKLEKDLNDVIYKSLLLNEDDIEIIENFLL